MSPRLRAGFPVFFVLLWSTDFIVARYGMPYAEWKARHQTEASPEQKARMQAATGTPQH